MPTAVVGVGVRLSLPFVCLFFHTMSQKLMQLGSPNLTYECSTMSPENPLIFRSHVMFTSQLECVFAFLWVLAFSSVWNCHSRVRKILNLRIFDDDDGKRWMKCVTDKQYEILCVSQVIVLFKRLNKRSVVKKLFDSLFC